MLRYNGSAHEKIYHGAKEENGGKCPAIFAQGQYRTMDTKKIGGEHIESASAQRMW